MYLAGFVIFNDFRAPKPFAAVSQLPAALRLPKKKTPREFWSMYLVDLVDLYRLLFIVDDFRMSGLVFLVSGLEPAKCERCK